MHTIPQNSYSYDDEHFNCSQRTFIANSGFGWIDMSVRANELWPSIRGTNILPVTDFSDFSLHKDIEELAYLIHRSAEALIPFPYLNSSNSRLLLPSLSDRSDTLVSLKRPARQIHIILITICSETQSSEGVTASSDSCVTDTNMLTLVESLISMYAATYLHLTYTTVVFSIHEHPVFLHALHSATRYTSYKDRAHHASDQAHVAVHVDGKELLRWLWMSSTVRHTITRAMTGMSPHTLIVPLFSLQVPHTIQATFQDNSPIQVLHPSSHSSRHSIEIVRSIGEDMPLADWPATVVLVLRSAADRTGVTDLMCGSPGEGVRDTHRELKSVTSSSSAGYLVYRTFYAILSAVWGVSPAHEYYSCTARQWVTDYLWAAPQSLSLSPSAAESRFSFREKRLIQRLMFISYAHELLARLHTALDDTMTMVPPVNITVFLGFSDGQSDAGVSIATDTSSPFASRRNARPDMSSRGHTTASKQSFLERFLYSMDKAAREASQMDFEAAMGELDDAERFVLSLEDHIKTIASSRKGAVFCDTPLDMTGNNANNSWEERNIWFGFNSWGGFMLIFVAALIGSLFGAMYSLVTPTSWRSIFLSNS
eukprot:CAMPEP_0182425198 /NCGR_PEP_ID=MMETSP1167-20130531/11548_1 /TAXON_ID=2988 /ORGANISM="Mallomonas Sp, Strain CCMP3275" /LENGTH=595 /DNA_ID=CAMNT_0024605655 /DNA_START=449 /DNA_END=2233 /DNA_ORIENTATION=-